MIVEMSYPLGSTIDGIHIENINNSQKCIRMGSIQSLLVALISVVDLLVV